MKNLFTFNVTTQEEVYKKFLLREVEKTLTERGEKMREQQRQLEKKAMIPEWVSYLQMIVVSCSSVILIKLLFDVFELIRDGKDWLAFLGANKAVLLLCICGIISFIGITFYAKNKMKMVMESEEFQLLKKQDEDLYAEWLESVKVPADAVVMDVFSEVYKLNKKGEEKSALPFYKYFNLPYHVFREEDTLCFGNIEMVCGIPLNGLKRIVKCDEKTSFSIWNKEEGHDEGKYKAYKISVNKLGTYYVKPYYALQFTAEGEEYQILFPPYELDSMRTLTGLEVEEV